MRLAILLAGVALATPALASGPGSSTPRGPTPHYGAVGNPHNGCGTRKGNCGKPAHPAKPPKLAYEPVLKHWGAPPKGTGVGHSPNVNYSQNSNTNGNWNRNSARAGARAGAAAQAGATAGASATGGTATASNSNTNNANNSSNLSSNVTVEGDTYIHREARNRRIPVSTAYAAPLTSGIDTCLGSASAGVQTGILGVSLGGTKRDRICETIKLSRELHHMGMREGAVQLLCIDERVRVAMRNAGTPCEEVTYAPPPPVYDEPPPPPEYAPPPRYRRRGERG
jgi:hypothetical protein